MPQPPAQTRLKTADLRSTGPTRFALEPDGTARAALADELGLLALRKLRLKGSLSPQGRRAWALEAELGATVTQACVVTLEPVTTRIDTTVTRRLVPPAQIETPEPGSETEMPEDDEIEPLGDEIDLWAILTEALALALPAYPRKPDATLGSAQFAEDGVTPLRDDDLRPFAGLAGLRDKLQGDDGKG